MKKFFLFCAATLLTVISANADVTVKVKNVPWEACYAYTWGGLSQNGTFAMTKEGDYFTYTFTDVTGDIEMLIKNTESDWDQQSNDFPKFSADACFSVSEGEKKLNVVAIDCATGDLPTVDAYYIKNNWNSSGWAWQEMTPNQDKSEWTYTGVYGGSGVNINTKADDAGSQWFPQDKIQGTATVGAEVTFTYNVAAGTVTAVSGDTPTPPAPGTNTYYLVGYINGVDYGISGDIDNMGDYNLTTGPVVITFTEKSYVQVKNQNKSIYGTAYVDATEPGSTVLSVGATDKIGLPANVEITFTLTENADGTVTLAYTWGDTPTPPTPAGDAYYIKNCWNGGEWTWQEMTPNQDKSEWTYTGVYGGTGVNINTKADDVGAQWFEQANIQGTATQGAEVTFTYNVAAGTVTAVSGDTPTPPAPGTNTYYLVGYINGVDYGISGDIDNMGDYNLTAGPVVITFTEKSYVQVKNQNKSIYGTAYVDATEPGSTVLSVGATDKIGLPANVEITFTLTENADGTVTLAYAWGGTPTPPTPGEEGFGIILGDGSTVKGWKNEGQVKFLEYMIEADLTTGATFQLYDFGNKAPWTEQNIDEASTPNVTINASGVYEVAADGHYTIYLKMYGPENNQVYIGYTEPTSIREATIKAAVKKMVVNGIFYIVKDNKAYTAYGF